ncbi:MAG: hypothetical protein ACI906_004345 [Candidatus Latescibacterota bacterium]|jgi:hypothetical protein
MLELQTGDGPFEWKVHPLVHERVAKSLSLVAIIHAVVVVVFLSFEPYFYGIISYAVLVASLSTFLFPSYYKLDETGIHRVHLGRRQLRRWAEFRRVDESAHGLFLSPFSRPSRLDSFRGFFLPFHQNQDLVVYYVRRHVNTRAN